MTRSSHFSLAGRLAAVSFLALAATAGSAQGRFTVSADGQEVSDATTRLVWRRCAEGMRWDGKTCGGTMTKYSYATAKQASTSGANGWRIPTKDELVTLVDMGVKKKPHIDASAFPKTPSAPFWASRPGSDDNLNAWLVNFSNGKVHGNAGQAKFPLRLVRAAS